MKSLYYFVSDVHLGLRSIDYKIIEQRFLSFLDSLPAQTKGLYLLGDIFDFWYEYKYVIPRGHTRVLGRLASLRDSGVEIFFFKGNHDVWAYNYFEEEIGIKVLEQPAIVEIEGKRFCLGHGDGLGDAPKKYLALKSLFNNRCLQRMFSAIHPRWAFGMGYSWSKHSRLSKSGNQYSFRGKEEPICKFAESFGVGNKIDYFIFGHFHSPAHEILDNGGELLILGEWINCCDYIVFDGNSLSVCDWNNQ